MANTIGELVVRLGFDPSGLDRGASAMEARLERTGTRLYFLGSRISAAFSLPLAGAVALIGKFGLEFNQAMTESLAIMDKVTPQMRSRMEEQARVVSETTKFSATESAKAYYELASAGMDAATSMASLPVVARFAQAGMFDLSQATQYLAGAQAALGKNTGSAEENMKSMAKIADVLTEVNNRALGKVEDFAAALSNRAGAALRLFNKDVEEGVAVLGAYAEQNVKGRAAGNQLFMMMRDLSNAAVKLPENFKQAGVAVFDSTGKMRNMADIIQDLERRLLPMSDAGKRSEMMFLGLTARSQGAIIPLIGLSDKIRALEADLRSAGGATDVVAQKQLQSLSAQLTLIKNSFVNTATTIFQSFVPVITQYVIPAMQSMAEHAKAFGQWIAGLSDRTKLFALVFAGLGATMGPITIAVGGFLLTMRALFVPVTVATSALAAMTAAYELNAIAALQAAGASEVFARSTVASMTAAQLSAVGSSKKMAESIVTAAGEAASAMGPATVQIGLFARASAMLTAVGTGVATFFASWAGVAVIIAGVVLAVRSLVDSWTEVWNIMKLIPGVFLLEDVWMMTTGGIANVVAVTKDLLSVLGDATVVVLGELSGAFKKLAEIGGQINTKFIADIFGITPWIDLVRSGIDKLTGNMQTNHKEVGFWADRYRDARKALKEWADEYRNAIPAVQNLTETENRHWANRLAWQMAIQNIAKGQAFDSSQFSRTAQSYLDATFGTVDDQRSSETADESVSKRLQSLMDRLSGTTALADAKDWNTVLKDMGGVSEIAAGELKNALGVFEAAIERLTKMGRVGTETFRTYAAIVQQIKEIQFAESARPMRPGVMSGFPGQPSSLTGAGEVGWLDNDTERYKFPKISSNPIAFPADQSEKFWEKAVNSTSSIAGSFAKLSQMTDGMLSNTTKKIGEIMSILAISGKSGITFKKGLDQVSGAENWGERIAGMTMMADGALGAWGAFSASTNNRSQRQNILGGAAQGAEFGSAFGPWGTLIGAGAGAIVAAIKGRPEWAKMASDIGRDFGISISDELAKALEADSRKYGRQATMSLHIKELVDAAGGLNSSNLDRFTQTLRDTFSMVETGRLTVAQATGVMNDNFAAFAAAGTDAYGRLSDGMREIITLNERFGTQSKAVSDWFKSQGSSALESFGAVMSGFTDLASASAEEIQDLAIIGLNSYLAAVGTGMAPTEAMKNSGLVDLKKAFQTAGLDPEASGLGGIFRQMDMAASSGSLMNAISALSKGMSNLSNIGLNTVETFKAQQNTGSKMYERLQAAAAATGGTTRDALLPMQDYLHNAQIEADKLGVPLDANTQMMIDQSKELGIWKERGPSATDLMIEGMDHLVAVVKDLINQMKGIPTHFETDWQVNRTVVTTGGGGSGGTGWPYKNDDGSDDMDGDPSTPMAIGGMVFGPRKALIGERGPEAVLPIDRAGGFFKTAMAAALAENPGMSGGTTIEQVSVHMTVTENVDQRALADNFLEMLRTNSVVGAAISKVSRDRLTV